MLQCLAVCTEGGEDGDAQEPGDGGEQRQQDEAEGGRIPGIARGAVAVAAANGTGDQHGGGDAERDGDGADEIQRGGGKADAGNKAGIAEAANKENIDEIDDESGENADAARQRHIQQMTPNAADNKRRVGGGRTAVHDDYGSKRRGF